MMTIPRKIEYEVSSWDNFRERPDPTQAQQSYTVGWFFRGSAKLWYCESYDPRYGYWMAEVNANTWREFPGREVTNVSERAIGRTFHKQYRPPDRPTIPEGASPEERLRLEMEFFKPKADGVTRFERQCETCGNMMVLPMGSNTTECSRCLE